MAKNINFKIAELSLQQFQRLPKTGKPKENEWTVLSCIIKEQNSNFEVVSIGTGSKCIGKNRMCPKGTILNDSHAEFNKEKFKFSLKPNIKFHFFTTRVPCGDAAIFPKESSEDFGDIIKTVTCDQSDEEAPAKKPKTDDIFRTGAKCLAADTKQDSKQNGSEYHIIGVVRTKPGRGDPTASVSCSDKLSKWCHLGIQGNLLMNLLDSPIYLSTFTILSCTPFCNKAFKRALFDRLENVNLLPPYDKHLVDVQTVDLAFSYSKTDKRYPCPSSIAWFQTHSEKNLEVCVNGRKQGTTKKNIISEKGRLKICKLELFKIFVDKLKEFNNEEASKINFEKLTYTDAKKINKLYLENWIILRKKFGVWTSKNPSLLEFYTI